MPQTSRACLLAQEFRVLWQLKDFDSMAWAMLETET